MRCVDVNVLVYAHRTDIDAHEAYRERLTSWANDDEEPLAIPDVVISGYLRVITNRRIFNEPTEPELAWEQVAALTNAPAVVRCSAGPRHWDVFARLAAELGARGNDVADAFLAAYAVERNATWLSADRSFARFPRLRWQHPLD